MAHIKSRLAGGILIAGILVASIACGAPSAEDILKDQASVDAYLAAERESGREPVIYRSDYDWQEVESSCANSEPPMDGKRVKFYAAGETRPDHWDALWCGNGLELTGSEYVNGVDGSDYPDITIR